MSKNEILEITKSTAFKGNLESKMEIYDFKSNFILIKEKEGQKKNSL